MKDYPDISEILDGILLGVYDDNFTAIKHRIQERTMRTREFIEWLAGARVMLNDSCRPKYLIGAMATVSVVNRTKVSVRLDTDAGRFSADRLITVPMSLLDKIS